MGSEPIVVPPTRLEWHHVFYRINCVSFGASLDIFRIMFFNALSGRVRQPRCNCFLTDDLPDRIRQYLYIYIFLLIILLAFVTIKFCTDLTPQNVSE